MSQHIVTLLRGGVIGAVIGAVVGAVATALILLPKHHTKVLSYELASRAETLEDFILSHDNSPSKSYCRRYKSAKISHAIMREKLASLNEKERIGLNSTFVSHIYQVIREFENKSEEGLKFECENN